jgi:transcriptional regulator GlxA family with amidase domain
VVDVASLPMRALMQTFLTLHGRLGNSLSQDDILFSLLEEILVYQLLSSWPRRGTLASGRAQVATSRHVRTAMDYIDAHIAERLTLAEVAKAARSSVRALQVAFRNELGTTPFGYIIDLRLDRVYADLASHGGSQSIKVVAGRWGFVHMSDFTKRFRQRFGHVPSETQWKSKIATSRPPSCPQ